MSTDQEEMRTTIEVDEEVESLLHRCLDLMERQNTGIVIAFHCPSERDAEGNPLGITAWIGEEINRYGQRVPPGIGAHVHLTAAVRRILQLAAENAGGLIPTEGHGEIVVLANGLVTVDHHGFREEQDVHRTVCDLRAADDDEDKMPEWLRGWRLRALEVQKVLADKNWRLRLTQDFGLWLSEAVNSVAEVQTYHWDRIPDSKVAEVSCGGKTLLRAIHDLGVDVFNACRRHEPACDSTAITFLDATGGLVCILREKYQVPTDRYYRFVISRTPPGPLEIDYESMADRMAPTPWALPM